MARRTKIVCTLGPASQDFATIRALVEAGMDVARLNFSHGNHDQHATVGMLVREASEATGRPVGLLADLQGPKIRLGTFQGGTALLEPGAMFVVSGEAVSGTSQRASVSYGSLARDLAPGDTLLMDDGLVKLLAVRSDGHEVSCQVIDGGNLSDCKGVNLPGARLATPVLSDKDTDDLRFALALGVDMVALSFVRRAEDAVAVRQVMDACGRHVPVIAKIEKPEAVEDLDAIVEAFDAVLMARGDLGVEIPLEQVPLVQKRAVQAARERGRPVIVATQMLESMVHNRRPTRAEVSDVANAVRDGADALMLAGETSVGEHPVDAVATMARIISAAEEGGLASMSPVDASTSTRPAAVAAAAVGAGRHVGATALAVFTQTGSTARSVASHRPTVRLLALTSDPSIRSQLSLVWGVEPVLVSPTSDFADAMEQVDEVLRSRGGQPGERVVVVAGQPGQAGSTHTMRVHELSGASGPGDGAIGE